MGFASAGYFDYPINRPGLMVGYQFFQQDFVVVDMATPALESFPHFGGSRFG